MAEASAIAALIVNDPNPDPFIAPYEVLGLADLFITQCQTVEAILTNTAVDPENESYLAQGLRAHMLGVLRQQLEQAKETFPNSEAFQEQRSSGDASKGQTAYRQNTA